jgi:predicted RNase H-like nuclease (RuvC/YqgF family)
VVFTANTLHFAQKSNDELIKNELSTAATDNTALRQQVSELEDKLKAVSIAADEAKSKPPVENEEQAQKIKELEKKLSQEQTKYSELEKEQEDLLVCMGMLFSKKKDYLTVPNAII